MSDGEVVSLDWIPKNYRQLPSDCPIIILVPGLTNDSRSRYAKRFVDYAFHDYGFRACIFNRRGYSRMPFQRQNPDPITWNKFDDLHQVID